MYAHYNVTKRCTTAGQTADCLRLVETSRQWQQGCYSKQVLENLHPTAVRWGCSRGNMSQLVLLIVYVQALWLVYKQPGSTIRPQASSMARSPAVAKPLAASMLPCCGPRLASVTFPSFIRGCLFTKLLKSKVVSSSFCRCIQQRFSELFIQERRGD
jgi:hypothetical protein